jgi:hypothetical protein
MRLLKSATTVIPTSMGSIMLQALTREHVQLAHPGPARNTRCLIALDASRHASMRPTCFAEGSAASLSQRKR